MKANLGNPDWHNGSQEGETVNGLLKNRESPSSRGPAGCKARNRGSKGDAMGPALHTREG